jgi:serine/threonine protein kinase
MVVHHTGDDFIKIVYAKVQSNGTTELVPFKLYIDGSLEQIKSSVSVPAAIPPETTIDNRYAIEKILGQGGFGRTYLAKDRYRFDEPCVLKEILFFGNSTAEIVKSRRLFEREAKILHQIQHGQIPKFLACFEENNRLFLAQEYIHGRTYSSILRERRQQQRSFSEAEITHLLKQLLPVLEYVHNRQIIHRDISPDNIIWHLDRKVPILIDFGVGKQLETSQIDYRSLVYSRQNSIVGKIHYAPYEQIYLGQCLPCSDIYSLAVTAIVLLTGKEPELLRDRYSLEWQWQQYTNVSQHLAHVLTRMLTIEPSNRYQTAKEVLADLDRVRQPVTTTNYIPTPICTQSEPQPAQMTTLSLDRHKAVNVVGNAITTPIAFHKEKERESQQCTILSSAAEPESVQVKTKPIAPSSVTLHPAFIARCEREMTRYIGPVAQYLIAETISKYPEVTASRLIELLARHIPHQSHSVEFKRSFLTYY